MPYKEKKSRKSFYNSWKDRGYEKGETQHFWLDLLSNVLGYAHNDTVVFEHRTSTGGYIDVWIRQSDVMVEQKALGVDLDKPEPRRGIMVTPLEQVIDYASSLPLQEQPKYLITCNFNTFRVYDRTKYGDKDLEGNQFEFSLSDLVEHPEYLGFIVDPSNNRLRKEKEVSEQAGRLIGSLYDMLLNQYHDPDSEETKHSLNVLCVRLVFCLFCEDAGLFGEPDAFCNYLKNVHPDNIRIKLQHLFDNLDTPRPERDEYDDDIKVFPYVNGGLFREKVIIPNFTQEIKDFLLEKMAFPVNWSNISPTIFGGIFESTLNPETRRKGGMHYTSPENIHKVIDPLFLDDLKKELNDIRTDVELSAIKKRNRFKKLHEKICSLVFFDPACGSGNFLTETYICLRQLEYAILKEYKNGQVSLFDSAVEGERELRVKLDQFYGIEINDFAVAVAETALWISRLKANQEYLLLLDLDEKDFPLTDRANIICENALRYDWNDLVEPSRVSYIMGNPPFVGAKYSSKEQKDDMDEVYSNHQSVSYRTLDYVSCWYYIAADYIRNTSIEVAFVSTNSICQGEQASVMWKSLLTNGVIISFAHRTFIWDSETQDKAHVHCVIIGFSYINRDIKYIYDGSSKSIVSHINPYLIEAEDVYIETRKKPITDGVSLITKGSQPTDGGNLILTPEERLNLLSKYPELSEYIKRYMGAVDFLNNEYRYCLWLKDFPLDTITNYPELELRLKKVRESRLNSTKASTRKCANSPALFTEDRQPNQDYIILPVVSSERRYYMPIGWVSKQVIANTNAQMIPGGTLFDFGIIMSIVHNAWMRTICGRMKSDYAYSATIVYNNFPWPTPTDDQKAIIEQTAQGILDARALYPDKSLADLYDPDKMPPELKAAHEANDKAVMDAYGFSYDMTEPQIVAALMKMYQELISTN